ncbi:Uncharacterised protein [Mesomycoplasma dispar]|uniref:Uncharacterized protein n=1 Tax=Mesomycoplasma dispar TaxID=86660 RepID=A0AAJ5NSJ2_9BACT|nr:hypothetical protein [Mesomycoplasma dispar]AJR12496.1 hypothetical protein MDIS_04055 [Mesomycoplasma dispar]VEU62764.1 Uncharacterised protein [Mesomycoplasma dispar]
MTINKKDKSLGYFKILVFFSLSIRVIKFVVGIILFFIFLIPSFSKLLTNSDSLIINSGLLITIFIWILLTIISRTLMIAYIVKVSIPNQIFINVRQNSTILSKLSIIKTTAIIGFFIPYVDVISMIMFLLLISHHQKELINPEELTLKVNSNM